MMNKNMLKQMQDMQKRMLKVQEELGNATVEASAGGGVVKVVITGHQRVQSVSIDPQVVDPEDVSMLEDLVLTAVNEAVQKSQELAQERMGAITGGLAGKLPGLM